MTNLERLQNHKRVRNVSIEDGGDLLFVYLADGFSRYGTGPKDGTCKGFDASHGIEDKGRPYTMAENAKRALQWVNNEVTDHRGVTDMTRSEICPECCKNGGAIFRPGLDEDCNWQDKICQNCGYVKTPRKPQARTLIDPMTCTAEEAEKLNLHKLVTFHYFNEAGIYAEWKAFGDVIEKAVDAGTVKGGFWMVYGPIGYHADQLRRHVLAKRLKAWDVHYTIREIRKTIDSGKAALAEAQGE